MAGKNWTHLFIDGRRVSFDRRDGSVTLYPDEDFRLAAAHHLGHAEGYGHDWKATAPDGTTYRASGRKDAVLWLIAHTAEERAQSERQRSKGSDEDATASEEATAIIRTVWPAFEAPGPFMGSQDAPTFFIFSPSSMRDLLVALSGEGQRELPLATALERVAEHTVVMFSVSDPTDEPHAFEWGYLDGVAVEAAPEDRPDLGAYAEFYFEREGGDESMIGLPGLASTALVSGDAVTFEREGDVVVIAIAEPPPEILDVPGIIAVWEWDREAIIALANHEPPVYDDEEPTESTD